jgi:hypothetical protein
MKLYFTLSFLLFCHCFSIAQVQPPRRISSSIFKSRPRTKIDFDKPGNYESVIQIQKSEINPGSSLDIDIYFSGYGEVRGSKFFFSTEDNLFNDDSSYVLMNLGVKDNRYMYWGNTKQSLKGQVSRFVMGIQGIAVSVSDSSADKDWKVATPFIDFPVRDASDSTDFAIITELKLSMHPYQSI